MRLDEEGRAPGHLRESAPVGRHHRRAARHGLQDGQAEAFPERGERERVGAPVEGGQIGVRNGPEEPHRAGQSECVDTGARVRAPPRGPGHDQLRLAGVALAAFVVAFALVVAAARRVDEHQRLARPLGRGDARQLGQQVRAHGRRGDEPAFRVPLHPVVPVAFVLRCAYMLYSSVDYVRNPDYGPKFGAAVLAGLVVMAAGIPLYFLSRKR